MTELLYVRWNPEAEQWVMQARDLEQAAGAPPSFEERLPTWLKRDTGDTTLLREASLALATHGGKQHRRVVVLRPRPRPSQAA